ncbi:MAG: hypothetical protein KKC37_17120 [Proteobacteria bacterium]|nr:hypothetical protein [Pseudomonadota bacterium]
MSSVVWVLDRDSYSIVAKYEDEEVYELDLEDFTCSAAVLDWLIQISNKNWCSNRALGSLVRSLDLIFDFQSGFCSSGVEQGPWTPEHIRQIIDNYKGPNTFGDG